jgi:hypothetical protein
LKHVNWWLYLFSTIPRRLLCDLMGTRRGMEAAWQWEFWFLKTRWSFIHRITAAADWLTITIRLIGRPPAKAEPSA